MILSLIVAMLLSVAQTTTNIFDTNYYYQNFLSSSVRMDLDRSVSVVSLSSFDVLNKQDNACRLDNNLSRVICEVVGACQPHEAHSFYCAGRLCLNSGVDSYLVYVKSNFEISSSLYLLNVQNGYLKSWVLLSEFFYLNDTYMGHWYSSLDNNTINLFEYCVMIMDDSDSIKTRNSWYYKTLFALHLYTLRKGIRNKYHLALRLSLDTQGYLSAI